MNHLTEELVDALGAGDDSTVDALDEARIRSTINVDSEAKRDTKALLKGKNGLLLRKLYKSWLRQNRGSGGFKEFKKALQAMLATTAGLPESFWDAEHEFDDTDLEEALEAIGEAELRRFLRGMQEDEAEADEGELHEGSGVAATILKQLGGTGRLVAMIGAHTFIDHGNGVSFKWKARTDRPSKRGNYLKIALRNDEYDLTFQYLRGYNSKVVKELRGIQASNLKMAIERQTGLRLSL